MDFSSSQFTRINSEYKDLNGATLQNSRIIEVLLIDLTSSFQENGAMAYQFTKKIPPTEEDLKYLREGIDTEAFAQIGLVCEIKKEAKQVILANGDIIHYTHLITATGKSPSYLSQEFVAGLYALLDAIRMKRAVPNGVAAQTASKNPHQIKLTIYPVQEHRIEEIGVEHLPNTTAKHTTVLSSRLNDKTYQIQL